MYCPRCGTKMINDTIQAGFNERNGKPKNKPIIRCTNCGYWVDNGKKKDSSMSLWSCALSGIAFVLPLPILLSFPMFLFGMILGIIDGNNKNDGKSHVGAVLGMIMGIIGVVYTLYKLVSNGMLVFI